MLEIDPVEWNLGSSKLDPNPSDAYRLRGAERARTSGNMGIRRNSRPKLSGIQSVNQITAPLFTGAGDLRTSAAELPPSVAGTGRGYRCRMLGWVACSWDEPDLRTVHLRPMGSSQKGIYVGRMRHGFGQYFMGTGFLFMAASAISRLNQRPYVLGSLAMLWGWIRNALKGMPRYQDAEFGRFLRPYRRRALLFGKKRALQELGTAAR